MLDLATPALAALLGLGGLPPLGVTVLGLVTVFAGYTAVYALNDVVDYRVDQEKMQQSPPQTAGGYLDAILLRHPMAQGAVSFREGLLWTAAWALVALTGAYLLNPVCALIFLAGCLLEAIYCRLLNVSHLRTLISGIVKTLGGLAAVLAVNPSPSIPFLIVLFLWSFFWEIGGQNVPADWHDLEEDRAWGAKTIPVRCGLGGACRIVLVSLGLSLSLSIPLLLLSPAGFSFAVVAPGLLAGALLLLFPALNLCRTQERSQASALFNRASYYPLALLLLVTFGLIW